MSEKKQILFVDDEKNVLDALSRMLYANRSEWDMQFATSGKEALELMKESAFDVVVSDMRMPGMSGAELLSEVRQQYPRTVRMVLSGQADSDQIIKELGPIHQFLQKPCDSDTLKSTIQRTCALGELFSNNKMKELLTGLESLPSLPALKNELMAQLSIPDISPKVVGETISHDLAMTAKILQLVNSAFFGLRRHVGSPAEAVTLLGLDTIRSLVTALQVFAQVTRNGTSGFSQEQLLAHSSEVASCAKKIATIEGMDTDIVENTHLAGLLHDIGQLIVVTKVPEEYKAAKELMKRKNISLEEAEKETIGATHGEIGAYLLGLWGFDHSIVDAVAYHGCPSMGQSNKYSILTAVHVADAIAHNSCSQNNSSELSIDYEYLENIGMADRLPVWQEAFSDAA